MLMTLDVGNTNITIGVFDGDTLYASWRVQTDRNKTADEFGLLLHNLFALRGLAFSSISGVALSSVVPPIMYSLTHAVRKYIGIEPLVVGQQTQTGLKNCYQPPRDVGADRIVNAVGALAKYDPPLILVDFGTATTFCAISGKREYLGGAILPGIKISMEALFEKTAKLPRIEIAKPEHVIGQSTVESMQSGVYHGYVGSVDHIIEKMKTELGQNSTVIATGGLARLIAADSKQIDHTDSTLTLEGLRVLYQLNTTELA